jgi:hypothetical protein
MVVLPSRDRMLSSGNDESGQIWFRGAKIRSRRTKFDELINEFEQTSHYLHSFGNLAEIWQIKAAHLFQTTLLAYVCNRFAGNYEE